ncbi:O-acetyl-ADP-ribose deacetylase [Candidatus Pacearchaeota archaeon]|nr:O-acetyl-ADP-ribose deacetylase [Candidatus Pacearchaeota archaeon]
MKISIIRGDITKVKVDAIVNAANFGMLGGGGVDGAIRRAAGHSLQEECVRLRKEVIPNGLETGKAIVTKAYNLPAKIIIHTVGPRYYSGDINLLKNCYTNCLKLAEENNCESIAFPAISTGAYGCPIEKSAEIVSEVLENFKSDIIKEIILVLFDEEDYEIYKRVLGNGMKTDLNEIIMD